MDEDYYKLLDVSRDASAADIQKAYRNLARKFHPDVNPADDAAKEKFQQIQTAYDVLNNTEKRELYDRYGSSFESMGGGPQGAARWSQSGGPGEIEIDFSQFFGGGEGSGSGSEFGDVFRRFTGNAGRRPPRRTARGADLTTELQVPFQQAVLGGEAQLRVQRPDGRIESISVKIPAGIEDGKSIRLRGQGHDGAGGGPAGDLMIRVKVAAHPSFRRQGRNLEVAVPLTLAEAALGAKVDVPTPKGTISLSVPPATSSGKRLRIKGHGVQFTKGEPGDLFAEIRIVLPEKIDDEDATLVHEFDARHPLAPREELRW